MEPEWLVWAREIQGIAQSGLTFTKDAYDRDRYEQLRALAARMMATHSSGDPQRIEALFAEQKGYATPKIDVRSAVFRDGRILMVREVVDADRWTLPGGWADVNLSAAENAAKETVEEAGFVIRVTKLAAAWDHGKQGHVPPNPFSTLKLFFLGEIESGEARTSSETSEVAFFGQDEIPSDLSAGRVLARQIARMFDHHADPAIPTDFE